VQHLENQDGGGKCSQGRDHARLEAHGEQGGNLVDAARRILRERELTEATLRRCRDGCIGRVHLSNPNTS
jgi:hypothetical protein